MNQFDSYIHLAITGILNFQNQTFLVKVMPCFIKLEKSEFLHMGNSTVTELQFRVQFNLMWKSFETFLIIYFLICSVITHSIISILEISNFLHLQVFILNKHR